MNHFIDSKKFRKNKEKTNLFIELLKDHKQILLDMATSATQTPTHYHEEDLEFSIKSISQLHLPKLTDKNFLLRPKGKVLIGLSANNDSLLG